MSVFIQEVLGLLKRNKKQLKLDSQKDYLEIGRLYQTSSLNNHGGTYAPRMEPFAVKYGDLKCDILTNVVLQDGVATEHRVPMYSSTAVGTCLVQNPAIKDSIMIQNAVADSIIVNGNLNVDENLQVDKNSVLKLKVELGTSGDTSNATSLFNKIHDSAGQEAGAANRVLRSLADGRVVWSDDDPVVALPFGNIWVGNSSNIQQPLPPGSAGQLIISDGTSVGYKSIVSSAVGNLLGSNVLSIGSNIEIGTTINTLNDLASNATISDQLMIFDESASENKRIKLGDLMQSLSFVTGTGVATRVAFWSDTDELSSDANLFWHQTQNCLAIGAPAGTPTGVTLHVQDVNDANTIVQIDSSVNDVNQTTSSIIFRDDVGQSNIKNEIRNVSVSQTGAGSTDMRFVQNTNGVASTPLVISGGAVGINLTTGPTQKLDVNGNVRLRGGLYDGTNAIGTNGQVLSSTGSETAWINAGTGTISTIQEGAGITVTNGTGPTATVAIDYAGADNFILEAAASAIDISTDSIAFNDVSGSNTVKRALIQDILRSDSFGIQGDGGVIQQITGGETINFVAQAGLDFSVAGGSPNVASVALDIAGTDNFIEVQTAGTPATDDFVLFSDINDSNTVKKSLVSSLPFNNLTTLNLSLTTGQTTPIAGSISGSNLNLSLNKFGGGNIVGYVPDSSASAQSTTFLRADGTWQVPAGGGGSTTVAEGPGISVTGTASNPIVAIDYLGADNAILEAPSADPTDADFLWFSDTSDSGNIKKEALSKFLTQGSFVVTDGSSPQTIALGDTLTVAAANQASTFGGLTVNTTTTDTITIGVDIAGTDNLIMARATESNPATLDYYMFSDTSDGNTLKKQQIYLMPGFYNGFTLQADTNPAQVVNTDENFDIAGGTGLTTVITEASTGPGPLTTNTVTVNHTDSITAGTSAHPTSITVNASGHITAISAGSAPSSGTVTSVTAGEALEIESGSSTVNPTIGVKFVGADNLVKVPGAGSADIADEILFNDADDSNTVKRVAISALPLVTSLTAGTGCSEAGSGTTGILTLNVGAGAGLKANADDIAVEYVGTSSVIQSATNASGSIPDGSDLIIYQDVDDGDKVKYTEVKNLVVSDPGPSDYFSFNTSGIANQGESTYPGNNLVAYNSGTGLFTITFNQTRPSANYLVQCTIVKNMGNAEILSFVTRNHTTTGFQGEVIGTNGTSTVAGLKGSQTYEITCTMYQ